MLTEKVLLYPLPHKIKGFICADVEGEEVFILNSRLTNESNRDTMVTNSITMFIAVAALIK